MAQGGRRCELAAGPDAAELRRYADLRCDRPARDDIRLRFARPDAQGRHAVWVGTKTLEDRLPNSPLDTHVLLTHPAAPGRIYAALGEGLMTRGHSYGESRDGSATWRYSGDGFGDMAYLYGMAVDPADPDDIRVAAFTGPRGAHGDNGP